eukprot:TRINITY_DN11778_c0_g1_i3.p1 TRINITY_DN11778_c0_g1~~TRINITY_DN11778_c0_g1_i3.p1  ORF type:complete len:127 (-),score=2.72 TRINITY_DN11778_c0_g1_i3:66-446(-)
MKQREFRGHFCMLDKNRFLEFADQAVRMRVPSGSMVLWDSRTLHQGWEGGPRLAVPICLEPKKRRTDIALLSKHEACRKGLPTTHLSLIHISEPTRLLSISYAVFCLKKKKKPYPIYIKQTYTYKI